MSLSEGSFMRILSQQFVAMVVVVGLASMLCGCQRSPDIQSASGVKIAMVESVNTNSAGHTIEQQNIIDRIKADNNFGAVKHLYIFSAYSGQVIIYSTVKGKVTSGGKRLTPGRIEGSADSNTTKPVINVGNARYAVAELPNEDGTFGSGSADYLYWFSPDGTFHQHFLSGGQIVHISDQPMAVKGIIVNTETKVIP